MSLTLASKTSSRSRRSPKHQRVLERLRKQILDGEYPAGCRLPTETELPRILSVGKQTVVRALHELAREGLIVRRRGDGSYVADRTQPPLLPGRHLKLGILWPRSILPERLVTYFQGSITRGALESWGLNASSGEFPRVGEHDTTSATWTSVSRGVTVTCLAESLYSRQRHPELAAVRERNFDGLLSLGIIEETFIDELLGLGIPSVLVDFPNERFAMRADQVYVDPMAGYREAVRHLVARGCRRIHFVGSMLVPPAPAADMNPDALHQWREGKKRADPDSFLRMSAWRSALDECGIKLTDAWIHFDLYGLEAQLAAKLLQLPDSQRPDAVVCHGISQAEMLMKIFAEHGVPLLGAGAVEGGYGGPALPIRVDGAELGRTAAELLLWKLHRPSRAALRVGVPMGLVVQGAQSTPSQPAKVIEPA